MQLSALLVMHHYSSKARVLQVSTNVKYRAPLLSPQKQFKKKITLYSFQRHREV